MIPLKGENNSAKQKSNKKNSLVMMAEGAKNENDDSPDDFSAKHDDYLKDGK